MTRERTFDFQVNVPPEGVRLKRPLRPEAVAPPAGVVFAALVCEGAPGSRIFSLAPPRRNQLRQLLQNVLASEMLPTGTRIRLVSSDPIPGTVIVFGQAPPPASTADTQSNVLRAVRVEAIEHCPTCLNIDPASCGTCGGSGWIYTVVVDPSCRIDGPCRLPVRGCAPRAPEPSPFQQANRTRPATMEFRAAEPIPPRRAIPITARAPGAFLAQAAVGVDWINYTPFVVQGLYVGVNMPWGSVDVSVAALLAQPFAAPRRPFLALQNVPVTLVVFNQGDQARPFDLTLTGAVLK